MSHHTLGAFFSTVDDNAIRQEAMNCNHFLSLVVDTRGTYVARVTKRNTIKRSIHQSIVEESYYPTYEDKVICTSDKVESEKNFVEEVSQIDVYPLKIEIEKWESKDTSEWDKDIAEAFISSSASVKKNPTIPTSQSQPQKPPYSSIPIGASYDYSHRVQSFPYNPNAEEIPFADDSPLPTFQEPSLFKEEDFQETQEAQTQMQINGINYEDLEPSEVSKIIDSMYEQKDIDFIVLQLVAGNPFIEESRLPFITQYCVKLPTMVRTRFEDVDDYHSFMEGYADTLMQEISKQKCFIPELIDEFCASFALAAQDKLNTLPQNEHIKYISRQFENYII